MDAGACLIGVSINDDNAPVVIPAQAGIQESGDAVVNR